MFKANGEKLKQTYESGIILEEEILEPGQQITLDECLDLNYIIV